MKTKSHGRLYELGLLGSQLKDRQAKSKDGVWTNNGLSADFRLVREHLNAKDVYLVETACGEAYAYGIELTWDCKIKAE